MKAFLLLLLPILTAGQNTYKGSIINKRTRENIQFATVGLVKQNIGINADEEGRFELPAGRISGDTFIISCIGFETLKTAINQLPTDMQFELEERRSTLKEVVISRKYHANTVELNSFSNCGTNYYTTSGYIAQLAQQVHTPVENCMLSEVQICKYGIAVIQPDKTIFRLRIYAMDTTRKAPSYELSDSVIEVKASGRRVNVNLEKYHIYIPGRDFFVSIEWVKIPYNAFKEKTKMNGMKQTYLSYSPLIAVKEYRSGDISAEEPMVWMMNYRQKWTPAHDAMGKRMVAMISATVKY